jgi:PH (Pleckstrin Homology) domain-containing protein
MPAGSDPGSGRVTAPPLPHTWRPFGVRVAVWVFGGLLLALVVVVWLELGDDIRAQFTPFQRGTMVFIGLLLGAAYHSMMRSRITATTDGLTVVNGYRKHTYEWSQLIGVSLRRGAPWGTLDLSDGTTISLLGVQGSDGARARRAVREIRAAIAANTPD